MNRLHAMTTLPANTTTLVLCPDPKCQSATRTSVGAAKIVCRSCGVSYAVERAVRGGLVAVQGKGAGRG